jgi:hypothetical protein
MEGELPIDTIFSFNVGINSTVFGSAPNKANADRSPTDVPVGAVLLVTTPTIEAMKNPDA